MTVPVRRDLVLLGGGHSHVAVLRSLGMRPEPGLRVTVVAREVLTPYSGMLPGLVAGHYRHAEIHVDLRPLARFAGARLYHAEATGIDLEARTVACSGRPPVPFDLLSVDIGSRPSVDAIAGAREHGLPVKPVDGFLSRLDALDELAERLARPLRAVVIGAGAGGVELALSVHHRMGARHGCELTIVTDADEPLPGHAAGVRRRLVRALEAHGVRLRTRAQAVAVEPDAVLLAGGERLACDVAFVVTHAAAAAWLAETGLALDARGFVEVDERLRSTSHPFVFATGDIASMRGRALPKSGVYAVRMGPPLTENLRRAARGEPLRPFRPQRRTLALISTGRRHAIASRGTLALSGDWVWRIKDWIDRRWMRRYQELPEMAGNAGDGTGTMHCGGCGAKVPAATVRAVLARLGARTADAHVALGLARPDDAAVLEVPTGEVLVQSVDHFRALLDDPYEFGRVTAVHCLGDLHAMGARPLAALATATLAWAAPEKQAAELEQLLRGAIDVIEAEGAVLAGGHTAEGPETAFGLTVNGLAARDALMTKGGLREGDALVLTKALGTGVVFAADMRAKASAGTIEAALTSMGRSSASAARIIAAHGAAGCTDVTGFGLAGHLLEMLDASGTDAIVDADALPVLPGALELLERGLRSTLQPGNEAAGDRVLGQCDAARRALLFDPQTAGGLLAGVPAAQATACVAALRAAGDGSACIIGSVHARAGAASAIRLRS